MLTFTLSALALSTGARPVARRGAVRGSVVMNAPMVRQTGKNSMDMAALSNYMNLPMPADTLQAEYVFIDGSNKARSKCRTLSNKQAASIESLPNWTYDGSSTGQAPGKDSEVIMKPVAMYLDPFRPNGKNILVLCDTYDGLGNALPTNPRAAAAKLFEEHAEQVPWFGIEQEYTLFNLDMSTPLGWPNNGYPLPQGPYYCGAGADRMFGRAISDAHYAACRYAGLTISGTNAEVMPGQWEYQVGPCVGIAGADQLWMSRYILDRVAEDFNVYVTLHPKPIKTGDWNGAGCHINFSTKKMRAPGGLAEIIATCEKMGPKHIEHIAIYGEDNEARLTGNHETCSINEFKYGVADRGASIRIPRDTNTEGCGYLEDRRPASNVEPYAATAKIMDTCVN